MGAVNLLKQWLDAGLISPTIRDGGVATSEEIAKGNVAMIVDGPWMPAIFAAQYPDFKFDLAPSRRDQAIASPSSAARISSSSIRARARTRRSRSCSSSDEPTGATRLRSNRADVGAEGPGSSPDVPAYFPVFQKQLETARPRTPSPAWPKIDEAIGNAVTWSSPARSRSPERPRRSRRFGRRTVGEVQAVGS